MESAFPGRYTGTGKRQKEAHYARKISRHRHRRIVRAAYHRLDGGRDLADRGSLPLPEQCPAVDGHLEWDIDSLFANVKQGIKAAFAKYPAIKSLSIDTWAVDYVLLKKEQPLYPVYAYRDGRTQAVLDEVHGILRLRSSTSAPASSFSHSTRCISCMRTKKPGGWRRQTIS